MLDMRVSSGSGKLRLYDSSYFGDQLPKSQA